VVLFSAGRLYSVSAELGCCPLGQARNCRYELAAGACLTRQSVVLTCRIRSRFRAPSRGGSDCSVAGEDRTVDRGDHWVVSSGSCAEMATSPCWRSGRRRTRPMTMKRKEVVRKTECEFRRLVVTRRSTSWRLYLERTKCLVGRSNPSERW